MSLRSFGGRRGIWRCVTPHRPRFLFARIIGKTGVSQWAHFGILAVRQLRLSIRAQRGMTGALKKAFGLPGMTRNADPVGAF